MAQAYNQFSPLNALAYVQEQGEMGRARGQQNQLAQLASQSYGANTPEQRQQLLTSMAVVNPAAAQSQQQQFQGNEDRQRKLAYGAATYLKGALDTNNPAAIAGAWRSVRPGLINAGIGTEADYAQDWQPDYEQVVHQLLASGDGVNGQTPTDVRSFQLMTAGLSAEDRERARRVNLGLDGRASTSGFSQVKVTGADGRERVGVLNGRTGQIDLPDGTSFNPQNGAITQTQGAQSAPSIQATVFRAPNGEVIDVSKVTEPGLRESIMQNPGQWGLVPDGGSAQLPDQVRSPQSAPPNASAFVGRAPEDQAAATEAARLGVQQAYLPQELSMRTDAAIRQAGGLEQVKASQGRQEEAVTRTREADKTLALLDEASTILPNATGGYLGAAADRLAGAFNQSTDGAKATARLKTIAGQLTSSMPRMQGPQSDRDVQLYKEMAGDLANDLLPVATRQAAAQTIRALNLKYSSQGRGQSAQPAPQRARNPQTGETVELRNGQWVPVQ